MNEIDEHLEQIRQRRDAIWEADVIPAEIDFDLYEGDVGWLLNYVDMLRAQVHRLERDQPKSVFSL